MSGTSGSAISTDGIPIHYRVLGDGSPVLVFVHGWCCDLSHWDKQLGHFAQRYRVVAIDLAGHGESGLGRKEWTIASFGSDVVAVLDELSLEEVVLIGHSMGGPVVVEAARRVHGRVVGVIGVDTFKNVELASTAEEIAESSIPFRDNFVEETRKMARGWFVDSSDPALVDQVVADISAVPREVGLGAMRSLRGNTQQLRIGLQELDVPVVAINSNYRANNAVAAQHLGIHMILMSGAGHFLMMEIPEHFNPTLSETIRHMWEDG